MTNTNDRLNRAAEKMNKMSITDLRQVARELGISRPAVGKKERLITEIVALAKGEINPVPLSTRGAPPKSSSFDRELYTEIMELRQISLSDRPDATFVRDDNAAGSAGVYGGILITLGKSSFLRCLPSEKPICVHESVVNKFGLRKGDFVKADCIINDNNQLEATGVISVNGEAFGKTGARRKFENLVRVYADTPLETSESSSPIAFRMTDFFTPIALGQRVLALTDSRVISTYVAGNLISGLTKREGIEVVGAFIGCTPEDRVNLTRTKKNDKLFFADFDEDQSVKLETLCIAAEHCKRLVESGKDAVLIVDGFFRPAKSFNEVIVEASGTLKKLLASAGKMEEGGSLTVIAISDNDIINNADRALIGEFADFENAFLKYTRLGGEVILDYRVSRSDFACKYSEAAGKLKLKLSDEVADIFRKNVDNGTIAQAYKD